MSSADYGKWNSPITVEMISMGIRLSDLAWDDGSGCLVWSEGRAKKTVLCCWDPKTKNTQIVSGNQNVRAEIGYGGGSFSAGQGHALFVEGKTGRIFSQNISQAVQGKDKSSAIKLTPQMNKAAGPQLSPCGQWVLYIHRDEDDMDCLAVASIKGEQWPEILHQGFDFYRQARWSSDGRSCAFVTWGHPKMPWESSQVCLASVAYENGLPKLTSVKKLETPKLTAAFQPEFSKDGKSLYFMRDDSGWGQLYRYDLSKESTELVAKLDGECAMPNWIQEMRTFDLSPDGAFAFVCCSKEAVIHLYRIDLISGEVKNLTSAGPWTDLSQVKVAHDSASVAFIANAPNVASQIVVMGVDGKNVKVVANSLSHSPELSDLVLDYAAKPQSLQWPVALNSKHNSYGIYYPPKNPSYQSKKGEKPPVILNVHGGPTAQSRTAWDLENLFFTSRGFAVLDLNHRGSTGYGREFMSQLEESWGVVDVEDAVSALSYLAAQGLADPKRAVIMGGSSGGYTVLQTLVTHPDKFAGAICKYGIGDLIALGEETHKFEQHYNDYLIGVLPKDAQRFYERSPLHFADRIKTPIALFHGQDDTVVPPSQTISIAESLQKNEIPHVCHLYDGEGHGFRKPETKTHYYAAVLEFMDSYIT